MSKGGATAALGGVSAGFAASATAIAAATVALTQFARVGIEAAANIEQLRISFEVMTGSAQTASALISDLRRLSAETPLNMDDVQRAARTLLAMGESTGAIIDELKMLGDVAAGSGQPLNELAQVFGQVMQAGRLTGNELRQFNERGVPVLTTLSQQLGVSKQAIRDMVEQGLISSSDVVKAFEAMTGAGGRFANMMERQTDTLIGQWNKLKENLTIIASTVMKPIADAMKQILSSFNELLDMAVSSLGVVRGGDFQTANREAVKALREQEDAARKAEKAAGEAAEAAEKQAKKTQKRAEALAEQLRSPQEIFRDTIAELRGFFNDGALSADAYRRGIKKAADALSDATKKATEFKNAGKVNVGALELGTMAEFSARFAGFRAMDEMAAQVKQQTKIETDILKVLGETKGIIEGKSPVQFAVARVP
jgi:tape measure domain-containing protein